METPKSDLDLRIERLLDASAEKVWKALTTPELLLTWFTPKPWRTVRCEMDLRPGGLFSVVMQGPEGPEVDGGEGCFLEVVEGQRLVWTSALGPGFRPNPITADSFAMTASFSLAADGDKTNFDALVLHADAESRAKHEAMGFFEGWGTMISQLEEVAKTL